MEKLRKILASLSVAALLTSILGFGAVAQAATFSDVASNHFAYNAVEELFAAGVVEGVGAGEFGCDASADRAAFSKMVALAFGFDPSTDYSAGFKDVPADAWFAGYVNVLAQNGIVEGYKDASGNLTGMFGPGDMVNRAAASKMLVLAAGLAMDDSNGPSFSDVSSGAWYYDYIETLYANSVVDGYGNGKFGPSDNLTRCQLAKMVVGAQNPVARDFEEEVVVDEEEEVVVEEEEEVVTSTGSVTISQGNVVAGGTVPKGATSVTMMNVKIAASSEAVRVSQLVFHRIGVGSSSDFTNVYLYEDGARVTTGRTVSSDTNSVTFSGLRLDVDAGESRQLQLVADFATGASASNSNAFEVLSADAVTHNGASTGGSFPIVGGSFTLSGSSAGTLTIERFGSLSNVTVGEEGAQVAKFKLTAANEDISVERIALRVRGSVSTSLLSNFVLWNGSTQVGTADAVGSQDLVTFNLATPLAVEKGGDVTLTLGADVGAADANDTILIDLDENTDLVGIGDVYGYGATVVSTLYDGTLGSSTSSCTGWTDASCVAVEGGQVTISFNGPPTGDIATNGKDVTAFRFTLTSQVNAEVRKISFTLAATTSDADAVDLDDLINAASSANFTDIKLVDEDTGEIVGTPQDVSTSGSDITQTFNYTDIFEVDAAESRNFKVTFDVANNSSLAAEEVTVSMAAISTSEGIRDLSTGEYITDIVPAGAVSGNPMTVEIPSLSVALGSPSADRTVVKGSQAIESALFAVTAGDSSDVKVTELKFTSYLDADLDGTYNDNENAGATFDDGSAGTKMQDIVSSVSIVDEDGNPVSSQSKSFSSGVVTFSNLSWTIPAGQTEKVIVLVNINKSGLPFYSNNDNISVDIADVSTDIVAEDVDGNSVSSASADGPNGAATPTRVITVREAGLITVASSNNPVLDDKAIAGNDSSTNPLLVARYRIYSQNEAFRVTKLNFINDSAADNSLEDNGALKNVILKYPTSLSAPSTLDGSANVSLVSGAAAFTGLSIMVPQSETDENAVNVEVYVTTNAINQGTTSGDQIEMDFDEGAGFEAVGQGSGTTVTQASSSSLFGTTADVDANQIALYKSLPTFDRDSATTAPCPATKMVASSAAEVYCFKVTANAAGDIDLYKLTFDITPNLLNTGTAAGQLASTGGLSVYEYSSTGTITETALATGSWVDGSSAGAVTFLAGEVVTKNTTSYYVLRAPISFQNSTDSSSLSVRLQAEAVTASVASTGASAVSGRNVWSDRSDGTHTLSTFDWTSSYKLENLPSSYLQLSE